MPNFQYLCQRQNPARNLPIIHLPYRQAAVLVAIAIPVFTSQLEKSREATDAANMRSAYAEIMASAVMGEPIAADKTNGPITIKATTGTEGSFVYSAEVELKQAQDGWQTTTVDNIGGYDVTSLAVGAGKTVTITYTQATDTLSMSVA